ncbi:MAG: ABC transporter ATP-binding protein [Prevotella sp.]|nr:ABC transporter ATP-binding protein [Candidatus Prevotella equi]
MELHDVTIGYRGKVVAKGLTATLRKGELTCLIGRNGTGKSTLMRTMAALQKPLGGTVTIDGKDIATMTARQRARLIGIVTTERVEVQNMTVWDMVAMGRSPYTGFFGRLSEQDKEIIETSLRMMHMETFSQRSINSLSDGERQKVMIAKTLAQQTPVVFLDEPTAFLDYPSKIETMQTLQALCHDSGIAMLLSTHDLDIALKHCDNVWTISEETLQVKIKN